jgi:hypothetical protein
LENSAKPAKKPVRWGRLAFILLAFILGCGLLTSAFYFADRSGLTNPWRSLPAPKNKPDKLVAGSPWAVFAQLPGRKLISCPYGDQYTCVSPSAVPNDLDPAGACPTSHRAFWPVTGAPQDRADCIEVQGVRLEQTYDVLYVLDSQGKIWRWISIGSTNDPIILPLYCLGGAAGGLLVGLVVCLIMILTRKSTNPKGLGDL